MSIPTYAACFPSFWPPYLSVLETEDQYDNPLVGLACVGFLCGVLLDANDLPGSIFCNSAARRAGGLGGE